MHIISAAYCFITVLSLQTALVLHCTMIGVLQHQHADHKRYPKGLCHRLCAYSASAVRSLVHSVSKAWRV